MGHREKKKQQKDGETADDSIPWHWNSTVKHCIILPSILALSEPYDACLAIACLAIACPALLSACLLAFHSPLALVEAQEGTMREDTMGRVMQM
jgi:hypothetical protein